MALSLLPAVLLFSLAYWLVKGSIEQWFSAPAVELHEDSSWPSPSNIIDEAGVRARSFAERHRGASRRRRACWTAAPIWTLEQALSELRQLYRIDDLRVL